MGLQFPSRSAMIRGMRTVLALLFSMLLLAPISAGASQCRLALVLALDVSGSVNDTEYRQQLDGLASALESPEVRQAVLSGAAAVRLAAFEWSSQNHQFVVQPWITLDSHAAIDEAAMRIRTYQKRRAGLKTALSTALLFAAQMLQDQPDCWKHTIDVSGDGKNNIGPDLSLIYRLEAFADVTVNALVVGNPASARQTVADEELAKGALKLYYDQTVVHGPGAFSIVADGYRDYARAMRKKLLREMDPPVIGLRLP